LTRIFAALITAAALFALAGYQVTSDAAGERLLGRLGASMVELDRWVPAHREDIQLQATERPGEVVTIGDVPLKGVVVPSDEAVDASDDELNSLLTQSMGRALYEDGTAALLPEGEDVSQLSLAEPARWTVELLSPRMHAFWLAALSLCLILLLALSVALLLARTSPLSPVVLGASIAVGCCLGMSILAFGAGFAFTSAIDKEIMLIGRDGALLGLRNAVGVGIIAGALQYIVRPFRAPPSRRSNRPVDLSKSRRLTSASAQTAGLRPRRPDRRVT
jgi:hypothetical protein